MTLDQLKNTTEYNQLKESFENILDAGYSNEILKALAVCLTLKAEGTVAEDEALAMSCRVMMGASHGIAALTFEERVLAVLKMKETIWTLNEVLNMDNEMLTQTTDRIGVNILDQVSSDYWGD